MAVDGPGVPVKSMRVRYCCSAGAPSLSTAARRSTARHLSTCCRVSCPARERPGTSCGGRRACISPFLSTASISCRRGCTYCCAIRRCSTGCEPPAAQSFCGKLWTRNCRCDAWHAIRRELHRARAGETAGDYRFGKASLGRPMPGPVILTDTRASRLSFSLAINHLWRYSGVRRAPHRRIPNTDPRVCSPTSQQP